MPTKQYGNHVHLAENHQQTYLFRHMATIKMITCQINRCIRNDCVLSDEVKFEGPVVMPDLCDRIQEEDVEVPQPVF